MKTTKCPVLLALCFTTTLGCMDEDNETEDFRMLPVAAQTPEGEILVGMYDEASSTLELVPDFVAKFDSAPEGLTLDLVGPTETLPFERSGVWTEALEEGSQIDLVVSDTNTHWVGMQLIVHEPSWTNGLIESEAPSLFPIYFDAACNTPWGWICVQR